MKDITKSKFSCVRDGSVIRGREYRPVGDGLPIAIVSHGFMANMMLVKQYARALASVGYCAFCFDFCGGCVIMGKSDGRTTEMSVVTEMSDLLAVIEYAKSLPYTDSSRLLLLGCSQGGLVSALTAAKLKDGVEKLVLLYPALCIPEDARRGDMLMARFDPDNIPEVLRCGPMKIGRRYVLDVIEMDPFNAIRGYENDVLIIHGTADGIVDISYSDRAEEIYRNEGFNRRVDYLKIDGGRHMFSRKHDKIAIEYIKKFTRV